MAKTEQQLRDEEYAARQRAIQEDLVRQHEAAVTQGGQAAQQQKWLDEQLKWSTQDRTRQITQLKRDKPEQIGRQASQFAAQGAFRSGARQQAGADLSQQFDQQIGSLRRQREQAKTQNSWQDVEAQWAQQSRERELKDFQIQGARQLEALTRQQEADQLAYSQQMAAQSERGRRSAASLTNPDKDRTKAVAYRDARINFYRSQGMDAAGAQVQALMDAKAAYPHLDETWWYSGKGQSGSASSFGKPGSWQYAEGRDAQGKPILKKANIGASRGQQVWNRVSGSGREQQALTNAPVYRGAFNSARAYFSQTGGKGSDQDFLNWWRPQLPGDARSQIHKQADAVSLAIYHARSGR